MVHRIAALLFTELAMLSAAVVVTPAHAAALQTPEAATAIVAVTPTDRCAVQTGCQRLAATDLPAGTAGSSAASGPARSAWELTFSGYAHHFRPIRCKQCERTDIVPGVGVQYRLHGNEASNWSARLTAGLQNDSFRHLGFYGGITGQRVYRAGWGEIEYGLGAFALRRTFSAKGGLEWILAPLPVLSLQPYESRWGVNVLAAPNFQHDGKRRSGFVFVQLSYALGSDR